MPEGGAVRVPEILRMEGDNGPGEHLKVTVQIHEAVATEPPRRGVAESSSSASVTESTKMPVFLQMRGRYTVQGTVAGREIQFTADGFAEAFREKE